MYWVLLLFLIIMFLFSFHKEHMTNKLMGPDPNPDLYGPNHIQRPNRSPNGDFGPNVISPDEPEQPTQDDGTVRSDTATKNNAIYFYKPFASLPFPTSPPPQPFLNDFSGFQR